MKARTIKDLRYNNQQDKPLHQYRCLQAKEQVSRKSHTARED